MFLHLKEKAINAVPNNVVDVCCKNSMKYINVHFGCNDVFFKVKERGKLSLPLLASVKRDLP
jgi:hypothetical protein